MEHKFKLHQKVQLMAGPPVSQPSPSGIYDIVRLLPQGLDGRFSYRLKSIAGERVAPENILVAEEATFS